jgi:hypothetical protein
MFKFTDKHIEEYQTLGYTVFRGIIPPALIDELRVQCDRGAELVRAQNGPQSQRFQPIAKFDIDQKPFEKFQNLDAIKDAVSRLIQVDWQPSGLDVMGVLIEPASEPYCMMWHRDWRDNIRGCDVKDWEAHSQNPQMFNQVNAALYEDSCTWVVPGSHVRKDTDAEVRRFPTRPIPGPNYEGLGAAGRERVSLDYLESLPGAQRLLLDAGDYCIYRNTLWHTGNYTPYKKRATLHDGANHPLFYEWAQKAREKAQERVAAGIEWENPNADRVAELVG